LLQGERSIFLHNGTMKHRNMLLASVFAAVFFPSSLAMGQPCLFKRRQSAGSEETGAAPS
jgi:hypothetical protein